MKLYVTRHGQTEWTVQNMVCGRTDCELTEAGRQQAGALAAKLHAYEIGVILSSPLKRAQQTAEILAGALKLTYEVDERLIEQSYGSYEGGSRSDPRFLNAIRQTASRLNGGEPFLRVVQRVYNLLDELPRRYPGQTVLLVGHGGVCKVIHTYFNDLSNKQYAAYKLDNCKLAVYDL